MSWIKTKSFIVITILSLVILFVLEGVTSITFYQITKPNSYFFSSTVETLRKLSEGQIKKSDNRSLKLDVINAERANRVQAYPDYLFNPHRHHPSHFAYLSNVAESTIIGCNENGFFNRWKSDSYGFRNPSKQSSVYSDILLIGDSFTAGACENEAGTIAGFMRSKGIKVANLGMGGSGPLHQLATIVEYGDAYRAKEVFWIVFTGNDLQNLSSEKTTLLNRYLDPDFTQNLMQKNLRVSTSLKSFLDDEINYNNLRMAENIKLPSYLQSDSTLDILDAEKKEKKLLIEVALRIKQEVEKRGANLKIVILNHINFYPKVQDIVSDTLINFAKDHDLNYLEFSRNFLSNNSELYTVPGPHFNAKGYRRIGSYLYEWLTNYTNQTL
jgi:lysophospholipase L1-like esterase